MSKKVKFKQGDKVLIQYPNQEPLKQKLTIVKEHVIRDELCYQVEERSFYIPFHLLIKAK